ncbi:MAG: HD domain-containing protein [Candidatus Thorarchaeota archaeon]
MAKGKGKKSRIDEINIANHPYNEHILPALRISMSDLNFVKDNMPFRDLMDAPIHGWTHVIHMLVYASALCNYSAFDVDIVRWAILLHDSGRYSDDREESEHGKMGAWVFANMASKALKVEQPLLDDVDIRRVKEIVFYHGRTAYPSSSTEEAVVRTADRLDLWRIPGFAGLDTGNPDFLEAPGWPKVEKIAKTMRLEGTYP